MPEDERPSDGEKFLYAACGGMKAADALTVNHALYKAQLAAGGQDTGEFPRHVLAAFDEAHTLEGVVTDHFGGPQQLPVLHLSADWNDRRHVRLAGRASRYFPAQWFASVCARVDRAWAISNEFFGGVQEDLGALEKKWFRTPPAWPDQLVEECKQFATSLAEDAEALRPQEDSRRSMSRRPGPARRWRARPTVSRKSPGTSTFGFAVGRQHGLLVGADGARSR